MGERREENERIKTASQHIKRDYDSLKLCLFDIVKQDVRDLIIPTGEYKRNMINSAPKNGSEEAELVCLCLGRSAPRDDRASNLRKDRRLDLKPDDLTLGLSTEITDVDDESEDNSSEVPKKSGNMRYNDEASHEQSQPAKRARVCVRARCDTPTMSDGCQWRKYGQKVAKGNPCPRAYYRCTVAPSCPVRKQVQRCADDMSILITTYEGTHNHALAATATAMASTTSAAASMLLSGSSATSPHHTTSRFAPPTLNALNFGHFDANSIITRPKPFYMQNDNNYGSSPLFPTIILDLTRSSSSSSSLLSSNLPRMPSSSLSFSNNASEHYNNWSPYLGFSGNALSYGHHKASRVGSFVNGGVQETLTETLTKAITADPAAFKSVIAAAISSVVGGSREASLRRDGGFGQRLTLGAGQNGKGLASSYYNLH